MLGQTSSELSLSASRQILQKELKYHQSPPLECPQQSEEGRLNLDSERLVIAATPTQAPSDCHTSSLFF